MAHLAYANQGVEAIRAGSVSDSVLASFDLTREEILEFAALHGDDPRRMQELWEKIQTLVDSMNAASPPPVLEDLPIDRPPPDRPLSDLRTPDLRPRR